MKTSYSSSITPHSSSPKPERQVMKRKSTSPLATSSQPQSSITTNNAPSSASLECERLAHLGYASVKKAKNQPFDDADLPILNESNTDTCITWIKTGSKIGAKYMSSSSSYDLSSSASSSSNDPLEDLEGILKRYDEFKSHPDNKHHQNDTPMEIKNYISLHQEIFQAIGPIIVKAINSDDTDKRKALTEKSEFLKNLRYEIADGKLKLARITAVQKNDSDNSSSSNAPLSRQEGRDLTGINTLEECLDDLTDWLELVSISQIFNRNI